LVTTGFDDKVSFIWAVADELRGDFKAHEYGQVILPFLVLRRLECALEPSKAAVIARAAEYAGRVDNLEPILQMTSGYKFYNTSPLDLTKLLNDPGNVAANLRTYIAGFSPGAIEVLERYGFDDKITRLDQAGLLYRVVAKFADLDLSEQAVTNDAMGYIFEELLRRFSEMSNETAGEHFTPREVIRLMVNILFAGDDTALTGTKPIRTLYDPACGTGGMLTVAQEHMKAINPNAVLEVYGQELNPETWAICRSDLMIKGQDPDRIVFGNSLTDTDGYPGTHFDYLLANPPFGVDWKKYAAPIKTEHETKGFDGRYGPGLPRVSDGSLLFLLHMISKMKPVADDPATPDVIEGGSRLAIVFSGSPLFSGAAGGAESEIRRWIIENDLLEGIVALPDQLFYNTGISTYFWILTNRKTEDRAGKIALVDARDSFVKMRKSLGDKRKYIPDEQIAEITRMYDDAIELAATGADKRVKVFDREAFGFQRVTVEQPMRRVWQVTDEILDALAESKAFGAWETTEITANSGVFDRDATSRDNARRVFAVQGPHATPGELAALVKGVPPAVSRELVKLAATPDPDAPVITNRKGDPEPDPDLRDQENIPLPAGCLALDEHGRQKALVEQAEKYLVDEIRPYLPDAWIDHTKTKIGYEIPFTRHFYEYVPPRPVAEIDAELRLIEAEIQQLLGGLTG
jgi:type I restriction enzyme M protein